MKLDSRINKVICALILSVTTLGFSYGQLVESGKIVFERKTNLLKIPNIPPFLKKFAEEKKYKVDEFVLTFSTEGCAFVPKQTMSSDPTDMLAIRNTVYTNKETGERMTLIDMMGNKLFVKDTVKAIQWQLTDNTRKLAGYNCKMAIYNKDDSTRIYAWYAEELIPSVGPETFTGLPGTILGLATEDGGIVYFAKSVEVVKVEEKDLAYDSGKSKVYSKKSLEDELLKQMGNNPMMKDMLRAFFRWY